jgi:sialate O-acetylesterase
MRFGIGLGIGWLSVGVLSALEIDSPWGSGMVLPSEKTIPLSGRAEPGAVVKVSFEDHDFTERTGPDGRWKVALPTHAASFEPQVLLIRSGDEELRIDDILIGEVWLCAGQSNMDFPLSRAVGGAVELARAGDFPAIRLLDLRGVPTGAKPYTAAEMARMNQANYYEGSWQRATPEAAAGFSAVAWWAGRTIHEAQKVPVGLIDVSVGGSGAEAWLPREILEAREDYAPLLGGQWLHCPRIGEWARGRARLNLGERGVDHPFRPGFLFEAGVRPWQGFPLQGVLWYQGETNAEIHDDVWNERLITDLVIGWRRVLEQPELPFFMVQLPRIGGNDPVRKWWPEFREVQARAAAKLDDVTLIPTADLGWDSPDVHPPDKKPVGERLGDAVLKKQAGQR